MNFDDEVKALLNMYYLSDRNKHNQANRVRQLNELYLKKTVEIIEDLRPLKVSTVIIALTNEFGSKE